MVRILADRLAEAATEWLHKKVRKEWGFPDSSDTTITDLLEEKFRGIRPAYGYPACPDHSEMRKTFSVLNAGEIGIRNSENNAIIPAASVAGLFFAHPDSHYFSIGRIDKEQVEDYGRRKGVSLSEAERLLYSNLGYF